MARTKGLKGDKALREFLSEAQDIAENLGQSLMAIDRAAKEGEPDPELVNNLFRGMHTLKSLAAMFEIAPLANLAHHEENLLEDIRLGRVALTPGMVDILFESLELITRILAMVSDSGDIRAADALRDAELLIQKIDRGGEPEEEPGQGSFAPTPPGGAPPADPRALFGAEVLEVLTEYEEHRLRTNLERGLPFFRIHLRFDLDSIDSGLESIKNRLKPLGEVITYLPSADEGEPDKLGIDIIIALQANPEELTGAVEGMHAQIAQVAPRREPAAAGAERLEGGLAVQTMPPPRREGETVTRPPVRASHVSLAPPGAPETALSLRSVSQSVRVDIRKLDRLMNVVGELAILRNAISRVGESIRATAGRGDLAIELYRINRGLDRRLFALREGILEVRMVPLHQVFDRLARMVRKVSRQLGKEIRFVISGSETEVDKLIIEELSDPLMHIVRNAIDHGIEDREARRKAGKPEFGTVAVTAFQKGNHVMIEVEDDGAGVDTAELRKAAIAAGIIDGEVAAGMTEAEITDLLFYPGISTSAQTTEISGRGVGMDVVKTNISALGGVVEVESETGTGTKFSITLPVTLAIIPALLVVVSGQTYAVPLNTVAEALLVASGDLHRVIGAETMTLRGETIPLCRLAAFFGQAREEERGKASYVVVTAVGQRRLGLEVDALLGQEDVVIKPLGYSLGSAGFFSGATDLGEERLALVIDPAAVIDEFFQKGYGEAGRFARTGAS